MGRALAKLEQAARARKAEKRQRQRVRRRRVVERRSVGVSRAVAVSNWKDAEAEVQKATDRLKVLTGEKEATAGSLLATVAILEKRGRQRLILSVLCGLEAVGIITLLVLR